MAVIQPMLVFRPKRITQIYILACAFGLSGVCLPVYADNITYGGNGADLKAFPLWVNNLGTVSNNLYAGSSAVPGVAGNAITVNFTSGTNPDYVIGGLAKDSTEVTNNTVSVVNGQINFSVIGGYGRAVSGDININQNNVSIDGGTIAGYIYGGQGRSDASGTVSITNNTVSINGGSVTRGIFGGYGVTYNSASIPVIVSGNKVTMTAGSVGGTVYGGHGASYDKTTAVADNIVEINGGTVTGSVIGGDGIVSGADMPTTITDNIVTISTGTVTSSVYGGAAFNNASNKHGDVTMTGNKITVTGGNVGGSLYGGVISLGPPNTMIPVYVGNNLTIMNNIVNVSDGFIGGGIVGGSSFIDLNYVNISTGDNITHDAQGDLTINNNEVNISGGVIRGTIAGGYGSFKSGAGDISTSISHNEVNISGGSIEGLLVGGYGSFTAGSGGDISVTDNTVNISGNPTFAPTASIKGGYQAGASHTYDVFTGNTLNFSAHPVSIDTVSNFENYNFTINPVLANTGTALISADHIVLGTDATNHNTGTDATSKITVVGIHSGTPLNTGDEFILMRSTSAFDGYGAAGLSSTGLAQQGISLLYDVRTDIDLANNEVTATIITVNPSDNGAPDARVNPQLKALPEGYLAGLMLVTRGVDNIAYNAFNAINEQNHENGLVPFAIISGSYSRYNSGSHIKSNDFFLTGGLSYQQEHVTLGAFLESGWGNYDSYNSFYNAANVHGDGNTRYFGAGLLGRYDFDNGVYTDASIRFGRNRTEFDTIDILNIATGQFASYNVKTNYASAHAGVGYLLPLNDKNELDLSAKYLHSTVGGKDVLVAGDPIHFDRLNSSRMRLSTMVNHHYSSTVTFNAGLGYEHEFDGKARATTYGVYNIQVPSVRGGTGTVSLGANIKPIADQNLSLDFKANGYTGKREGVGVSIRANYAF
ncbi:MAG: autotransporter outer membrane beta-barrel domain-containing protein [Rhodospirillaceae bacterium]|nr:autotransporter outer membrane beta-barrel domain-containing protein [Rhodospirillaceae bacterium]